MGPAANAPAAVAGTVKDLGKVEQSPQDDREYRALELVNGLQVCTRKGKRVPM